MGCVHMDLSSIEIFVKVVDAGSFSAAARTLGVSKSHTSKRVSQLEDRLGARLLQRTTRKLTLTEAGRTFYERCSHILGQLEEAEQLIAELSNSPRGRLRMAVPMSLGLRYLAPLVAEFAKEFDAVMLDVQYSDARVDLLEEDYDLAIRVGKLSDSSMVARKLAPVQMFLVAHSDYLAERGTPRMPKDLKEHRCLVYTNAAVPNAWQLGRGNDVQSVQVDGRIRSNNGDALLQAALAGHGIAMIPDFLCAEAIRDGRLRIIMQRWQPEPLAAWVIFPHKRHLSPKVRSFVDFLAERWRTPPWSCDDCTERED